MKIKDESENICKNPKFILYTDIDSQTEFKNP